MPSISKKYPRTPDRSRIQTTCPYSNPLASPSFFVNPYENRDIHFPDSFPDVFPIVSHNDGSQLLDDRLSSIPRTCSHLPDSVSSINQSLFDSPSSSFGYTSRDPKSYFQSSLHSAQDFFDTEVSEFLELYFFYDV